MLTNYELEITRELINIALANSADAFSKMASERVLIKYFDVQLLNKREFIESIELNTELTYALTTEVKGYLIGKSYLVFNRSDINKVIRIFAGKEVIDSDGELTEFQKAILLELDNILSAAMITQISNILGVSGYGDVPYLHYLSKDKLVEILTKDTLEHDVSLRVNAKFHLYNTSLEPSFIWLFKTNFIDAIKDLIKRKQHLSLLKEN